MDAHFTDEELRALGKRAARWALSPSARHLGSDVAQDAMLDLDHKRQLGEEIKHPDRLIQVIAKRRAWKVRDQWERDRDRPHFDENLAATEAEAVVLPEVAMDWLLGHLNSSDREIAYLTYVEGLKAPAVAERIGLAAGTVRNRLVRIRKALRVALDKDLDGVRR